MWIAAVVATDDPLDVEVVVIPLNDDDVDGVEDEYTFVVVVVRLCGPVLEDVNVWKPVVVEEIEDVDGDVWVLVVDVVLPVVDVPYNKIKIINQSQ